MPTLRTNLHAAAHLAFPPIDEVIASEALVPHFQPIMALNHGKEVHGYESLARYGAGRFRIEPTSLFEYARLCGRVADLELACIGRTLRQFHHLPDGAKLFINLHPSVLVAGEPFARGILATAERQAVDLTRVVVEITEQDHFPLCDATFRAIELLRGEGASFALDDVGVSYSHLDRLVWIRPSYLKISAHFGTGFESDSVRAKIVRNIIALAHDFECEIVLEGVETAATSRAAAQLGARYAQGFFYARPAPLA